MVVTWYQHQRYKFHNSVDKLNWRLFDLKFRLDFSDDRHISYELRQNELNLNYFFHQVIECINEEIDVRDYENFLENFLKFENLALRENSKWTEKPILN